MLSIEERAVLADIQDRLADLHVAKEAAEKRGNRIRVRTLEEQIASVKSERAQQQFFAEP